MLVDKMEKKIITFRVTSGDEIVGMFVSSTQHTVTVGSPAIITLTPSNAGQVNVNLGPFLVAGNKDGEVEFNKGSMICNPAPARPEAEAQYRKITLKE